MLGKLCVVCLGKYVRSAFLPKLGESRNESVDCRYYGEICVQECYFLVVLSGIVAHNYQDIHGNGFPRVRVKFVGGSCAFSFLGR